MADPIIPTIVSPTIDANTASINANTASIDANTSSLNDNIDSWRTILDVTTKAGQELIDAAGDLHKIEVATGKSTSAMNLLSSYVLTTTSAFSAFSNNLDPNKLYTYTDQINQLKNKFSGDHTSLVSNLMKVGTQLGIGGGELQKFASTSTSALIGLVSRYASLADSSLKFQQSFLDSAAATGQFGAIMDSAGGSVSILNDITLNYEHQIASSGQATLLGSEIATKYFAALSRIPGALQETISDMTGAGSQTTMLTATMNLATGSGMKLEEVSSGLSKAFSTYGISGQAALVFVGRMAELSQKLKVELADTKGYMEHMAEGLKFIGNNAESTARALNDMFESIHKGGISNKATIEIIQNMTDAVSKMGVAQRGFLSAQSGGPGGLQGAFQISKMMREDKFDEVMKMVRDQMTRQTGQIVSVDEAAASPQAASRLNRQLEIVQSGPLGSMAKDPASAQRLLDGLREMGKSSAADKLSGNILKDMQKNAETLENRSFTELQKMNTSLDLIQANTQSMALQTTQEYMGGNQLSRESFRGSGVTTGVNLAGESVAQNNLTSTNSRTGQTWANNAEVMNQFIDPKKIVENANKTLSGVLNAINSLSGLKTPESSMKLQELIKQRDDLKKIVHDYSGESNVSNAVRTVNAPAAAGRPGYPSARTAPGTTGAARTAAAPQPPLNVNLVVKAYCKDCGTVIPSEQLTATNPAANVGNR